MKTRLILPLILATLAIARPGDAAVGTVDLSWDTCASVVGENTTVTPGQYSLYVSELGNNQFTTGYQVRIIYSDAQQLVPDAWRFDPQGCQWPVLATMDHTAPASVSKACPSMDQGANSLQIKDVNFTPQTDPYSVNTMRIVFANAYPLGVTAIGTIRYFLTRILFDHTYSVVGAGEPTQTCGGFETTMTFRLTVAEFIDVNGVAQNFNPGNSVVTFNAGVPARATSWGSIKSQYRN
jgi:hypothetical protein